MSDGRIGPDGSGMPAGGVQPVPGSSPDDSSGSITLSVPRPEHQRSNNLYVDTPFQHKVPPRRAAIPRPPELVHSHRQKETPTELAMGNRQKETSTFRTAQRQKGFDAGTLQKQKISSSPIVTAQPVTFTKDVTEEDSILCSECGKCKCQACISSPQVRGVWLCGKLHCSPKTTVDYLSCLCCVRGAFYHCSSDVENAVDKPCSCAGPNRLLRWACLAAACVPLPCLLCYWPLEGVRRLVERTYGNFRLRGCRCPQNKRPSKSRPQREKRLLQDCV